MTNMENKEEDWNPMEMWEKEKCEYLDNIYNDKNINNKAMKNLKNFDEFLKQLIDSIENEKDIYVFGHVIDDKTDYQFIENEDYDEYYVLFCFDFYRLQELLITMFNYDEEEFIIVNDQYVDNDEEDNKTLVKRMHIFKAIK